MEPIAARGDKLIADVRQCSQQYGYDLSRMQGVGGQITCVCP
jgi:hypothetical protein